MLSSTLAIRCSVGGLDPPAGVLGIYVDAESDIYEMAARFFYFGLLIWPNNLMLDMAF